MIDWIWNQKGQEENTGELELAGHAMMRSKHSWSLVGQLSLNSALQTIVWTGRHSARWTLGIGHGEAGWGWQSVATSVA